MPALLSPNALVTILELAVSSGSSLLGRTAHAQIIKNLGLDLNAFISNHLINMYSKLHHPYTGETVLFLTPLSSRSVVTWTSLIAGCVQNNYSASAISYFTAMHREGIQPNDFTFPCLFKAASSLQSTMLGQQFHVLSIKLLLVNDVFVACSAFDMYSKSGLPNEANKIFDQMPYRNIATWNAYISNTVQVGKPREAVSRFVQLLRSNEAIPNHISFCAYLNGCSDGRLLLEGMQVHGLLIKQGQEAGISMLNSLVDFYGKCHEVRLSEKVFNNMRERSSVSWCSMLAVYEQNDMGEKACNLFLEARRAGVEPTDFMVSSVLSACAGLAALDSGRVIHGLAIRACIEENVFVGSALVDMYGKCGSIEDCEQAFFQMPSRNLICWNAMIGGYAHQGRAEAALELFDEMATDKSNGARPNYVTFVSVLAACSRAGILDRGMNIFSMMKGEYGVDPGAEHYACIVDMLGRAGQVERAYKIVKGMPISPTISIWGALLGACKMHGKPRIGKIAAENLFLLDPKDSGNHVILSNMFTATGQWDDANFVRKEMKFVGIKKNTGYSWISVKNKVHAFQAKDTSHARNSEIQEMLAKLREDMKVAGYIPDTKLALYDLEDEEKELEVWSHSEKIALAFGLIALPPNIPVRIIKNLRVCTDCHSAFKFISGLVDREIIVRDNNRFHRFRNNQCSCGDYW